MLAFVLCLHGAQLCAEHVIDDSIEKNWELEKSQDGIEVYTRVVIGSKHKAVKAIMTIQSSLSAAVGLVRDTSACPEWAALCKESYEHERVSETEVYVYSFNDVPWPVSDRDALAHVIWVQDPVTLAVTMTATATEGRLPEVKKVVRLTRAVTRWIFVPTNDGSLDVITEAHVDPSGPTPAWITNMLLVESPIETLTNMRAILATGRYDQAHFDFITEPGAALIQ
jgi:hypothetical protein